MTKTHLFSTDAKVKTPLLLEARWWRWRDAIPFLVSKVFFIKGVVPCFAFSSRVSFS